ncbi:iron uptake porin [Pseudanabaena yagii]|uniref:Iron uptake porin n=1 Tax=Pseudanabaena yagii GIHE-NHR1 TaxID=2722753 RepID=A0ABX1LWX1_9CYAN|nr:iron uptake porin [Pseudanabaena yagii]NMF60664.1 iron uptake porin [Pseudanabaena yagii GIHE-NHR1]
MSKASQKIALSFPILLVAAIASTSSVNANEVKKVADNRQSTSTEIPKLADSKTSASKPLQIDDVINVSGVGLQSPLPASSQLDDLVVPVTQLSDTNAKLPSQNSELAAVTSVSQLTDVKSTDWAFTALQSLVERYGVIAGYPDSTYRGKKALSRYEFAAGLNTALDKINEIISAGLADKVSKEDLATLKKLQEEFASELAALRGRVDNLEAKTAKIEEQQFSTTTKLLGSANFLLGAIATNGKRAIDGQNRSSNLIFAYSVNLRFNTSFTGKDLLSVNLGTNNSPSTAAVVGGAGNLSNVANFALDGSTATKAPNTFSVGQLFYRFPIGEQATVWISALGLQPFDFFPVISPLRDGTSVPNTAYGLFNPVIFRPGFTDTGIGAAYRFSDQWQLHAGYFASDVQASKSGSTVPTGSLGLFGGSSTIATQLTFKPSEQFSGSLNFIHKYWSGSIPGDPDLAGQVSFSGPTGTNLATAPFGLTTPTVADSFGGQFDWRIFPKIGLGGWFSTTSALNLNKGTTANVINAAISLGFFDLFKEGNHGGILVAIPPYVTSSNDTRGKDLNTPWLIEAFYTHRFNKNISITPDIYVVLNPDVGTPEPIWGFTLRTTFTF